MKATRKQIKKLINTSGVLHENGRYLDHELFKEVKKRMYKDLFELLRGDDKDKPPLRDTTIYIGEKNKQKKFQTHRNPPPPTPPLSRVIKKGVTDFCTSCGSTVTKNGWFGVLGEKLCNNKKCKNSLTRIK